MRREGWIVNHKKFHRVYRDEGLALRYKRKKRKYASEVRVPPPMPQRRDERRAIDFVTDATSTGRRFRVLTVIDVKTRECVALEFMGKLAALVPAPRANLVRYHGILAPAARYRARVVPGAVEVEPSAPPGEGETESRAAGNGAVPIGGSSPKPRPRNYSWADLMRRVFEVDVLECPGCGGAMRILAAIHPPEATRAILECLGLPSRAPPVSAPVCETSVEMEEWF
jgi:hypothetical protein